MTQDLEVKYRQADITPFWKKLPFFFLFPFRTSPLVFMACIAGASAMAGFALGAFGLVFKGFLAYLGLRYAFNVFELFAKGRFEGESVDHTLWGPEKRPAKLGLVITIFVVIAINLGNVMLDARLAKNPGAQEAVLDRYRQSHAAEIAQRELLVAAYNKRMADAAAAAARARPPSVGEDDSPRHDAGDTGPDFDSEGAPEAGPSRGEMLEAAKPRFGEGLWFRLQPITYWLVIGVLSLLLPAAAIVIALEDKFFKALNPLNVLHLVQTMGSAYFVLWGFFLAIAGTRQLVLGAGSTWSAAVSFPLEMAVANYLSLVLFAVMGYAIYQFHQELHLDVEVDFDEHRQVGGAEGIARAGSARAALSEAAPKDPLERKLQPLLAQGNIAGAIAEVKDYMRYDRLDPALNKRLHGLYLRQGDNALTLAHGQQLLSALARAGEGREALAALKTLVAIDPAFAPADADVVAPAAAAALQSGEAPLAANLLRNFDKRFPQHKDMPDIYFLGARLLSEHNRQHDKAARILRAVVNRFPDHAIATDAKTYLAVLENLLARSPAAG